MQIPSLTTIVMSSLTRSIATVQQPTAHGVEEALNTVAVDEHVEARADLERREDTFLETQREDTVQLALVIKG